MVNAPAGMPPSQRRPSSLSSSDIYGSWQTGIPTTVVAGTSGGARVNAATTALAAEAPITVKGPDASFLARPAGVLLLMLAALAIWSFVQGGT